MLDHSKAELSRSKAGYDAPMDGDQLYDVDFLIGERPVPEGAQLFLPDDDQRPLETDRVPPWIWRSKRRVIRMNFLPDPSYISLITLFMPFWAGEGEALLYETVLLAGEQGEIIDRAATLEEAREIHADYLKQLCEQYDMPGPTA